MNSGFELQLLKSYFLHLNINFKNNRFEYLKDQRSRLNPSFRQEHDWVTVPSSTDAPNYKRNVLPFHFKKNVLYTILLL